MGIQLFFSKNDLKQKTSEKEYIEKRMELGKAAEKGLTEVLRENRLDCLLGCGSRPISNFAPISGSPCMCLPAWLSGTEDWQAGSYYLMAGRYCEDILLHVAYVLEQTLKLKCCPEWTDEF